MNKLLSAFQDKFSNAKDQLGEFLFKERTLDISDKLINQAVQADERFRGKLSEKGLSEVHFQAEQDKLVVNGVLSKHVKDAGFKVELRPEKITWTKDEQVIFMKMLDYDLKMQQGGYFDLFKLSMVKVFMAAFGQETALKKANIEVQDGLIKFDFKDAGGNAKRIFRSIELKNIQCLPGSIAITFKPRKDMANDNMNVLKNWLADLRQ
ncbi:hypothetical protein [Desulfonatronovibrio magnus]|uniref:hypothetical protein n=1 Tax=Desulfonatronovibrio magnus TaxID=698827 RepID=UPI0005EACD52|nr:hypothetical protein [Desulfonatronovibrio magnus]